MDGSNALSPTGRAAVEYAEKGLAIIPLKPRSKDPVTTHGREDWSDDPVSIASAFPAAERAWWSKCPKDNGQWLNVGIVCGPPSGSLVVIDIDRHEGGGDGFAVLEKWEEEHGELPETVTSITGGGGKQLFYRINAEVTGKVNRELGVDLRYKNYVVAPPSIHPDTGESYEWSISPDDIDIAQADSNVQAFIDWLLDWRPSGASASQHTYSSYELPDSLGKGERNDGLYRYGCSLRGKGIEDDELKSKMLEANESVCDPPLGKSEMRSLIRSLLRLPVGMSEEAKAVKAASETKAIRATAATVKPDESQAQQVDTSSKQSVISKTLSIMNVSEDITAGLKYNEDEMLPYVTDNVIAGAPFFGPHPLTDEEEALLLLMVESRGGTGDVGKFRTATKAYLGMERHRYSPLKEAFSKLPLVRSASGAPIGSAIDIEYSEDNGHTWKMAPPESIRGLLFPSFLGVTISDYSREVEILISRGIVARAMHPGCKYDYMPIFLGEQGTGKSTVIRKLALEDEFSIEGFNRFDEEGVKRLEGKLIAEVGELSGFNGADMNAIKDFVTRTKDTYRRSYGRYAITVPRRCILIGTSNNRYVLDDATGNRRFLIIECGREREDPAPGIFDGTFDLCVRIWLAVSLKEREELGEAEFHKLLRLPPSVLAEAQVTQEDHSFEDSTVNAVNDYLDSLPMDVKRVNVKMVMMDGMGYGQKEYVEAKKWLKSAVATAIEKRGWMPEEKKTRAYNDRGRCFGLAKSWARPTS